MAKVIRRNTVSIGTVGAMAAMKPRPPSPRHNSLLGDLTNQATGLLSGKGAGAEHEVARLSSKIMDLMAQLHQRDAEKAQLESALDAARKEAANARSLLNAGAPAAAPAAEAPMPAAPAQPDLCAPPPIKRRLAMRKDVMLKVLSAALREADQATAMKTEARRRARARPPIARAEPERSGERPRPASSRSSRRSSRRPRRSAVICASSSRRFGSG